MSGRAGDPAAERRGGGAGAGPAAPVPAGAGAAPGGPDPTMEDILASIRRILNEEEAPPAPVPLPAPAEDGPEPLTLTEEMLVETAPDAPDRDTDREPDSVPMEPAARGGTVSSAEAVPEPVPPAMDPAMPASSAEITPDADTAPPPGSAVAAAGLLAPTVAAAAAASVSSLLRAVAAERGAAVTRGGPSIEDVVREEVRPLLKEWLDQHLPPLVERLVRIEIERVLGRALS